VPDHLDPGRNDVQLLGHFFPDPSQGAAAVAHLLRRGQVVDHFHPGQFRGQWLAFGLGPAVRGNGHHFRPVFFSWDCFGRSLPRLVEKRQRLLTGLRGVPFRFVSVLIRQQQLDLFPQQTDFSFQTLDFLLVGLPDGGGDRQTALARGERAGLKPVAFAFRGDVFRLDRGVRKHGRIIA